MPKFMSKALVAFALFVSSVSLLFAGQADASPCNAGYRIVGKTETHWICSNGVSIQLVSR